MSYCWHVLERVGPHWARPELKWEDVAMEHNIHHVHQLDLLLVCQGLDPLLQSIHLFWVALIQALPHPRDEPPWRGHQECWDFGLAASERLGDIKPLPLPPLDRLREGDALEPSNLLDLSNHEVGS